MMADMFADMIKKAIPPEVAELLTAEKMKEIGEKANAFITDLRQSMAAIQKTQAAHSIALAELRSAIDDRNNDSGKRTRKPAAGNGADASHSGIADD